MFVEEDESKSEGMIRIGALGDDYYEFNEKTYSIVGQAHQEEIPAWRQDHIQGRFGRSRPEDVGVEWPVPDRLDRPERGLSL
jgi:hypothetical protein